MYMRRPPLRAFVCLMFAFPFLAFAQPKLTVVGGMKFDLGDIYTTKIVSKNLTLKNVGTDTLRIDDLSATCGCTGTLMSNENIAPGKSATLSITFNPKGISGKVEKAVSMETNDPAISHARITFTANVVTVMNIDRDYIVYRTTMDSAVTDSFTVTNSSTSTIRILSVAPTVNVVSTTLSNDKLNAGESATIMCRFTPKKSGTTKGNIIITTDNPKAPSLDVRFFAWVGGKKPDSASTNQN